jgi:hypothetical protein
VAVPLEIPEDERLTEDEIFAILSYASTELTSELEGMEVYRDYYDNEQPLNYTTLEFVRAFGEQFEGFSANWCEVVVDAVEERIDLDRILYRDENGEVAEEASDQIWTTLHLNRFETLQNELYNRALVEGRSAVIVWPDPVLGARVDFQEPQNVLVVYDSDDSRKVSYAIKRWVTNSGESRLNLYLPNYLYKFTSGRRLSLVGDTSDRNSEATGWVPRLPEETGDPSWPLPNPFGEVPVVEFFGRKNRSELTNITPLQDMLNKMIVNMSVTADFAAYRQKYVVSSNAEPDGGWKSSPGYVWHLMPEVDVEGKPLPTQIGSLEESSPEGYIQIIEAMLQMITQISKTPTYYFFQTSKAGGRGDAPSGDSLRVTETGLIKKCEKLMESWSPAWVQVGRLIWKAIGNSELPDVGECSWANPQAQFMTMLLEEGRRMIEDLQLPPEMAWRHIGLSERQIQEARAWRDENQPLGQVVTRVNVIEEEPAPENVELSQSAVPNAAKQ